MRRGWMRRPVLVLMLSLIVGAGSALAGTSKYTLTKEDIKRAEKRLSELGYWAGPADGVWDAASRHALVAFQKIEGARPTGTLTRAEYNALTDSAQGLPKPRLTGAPHVEIDLARQVLYLVDSEGQVG